MTQAMLEDPGAEFIGELDDERLEALVETMYLVAYADGDYGREEREHFERCVQRLTEGRLAGHAFDHVVERLVERLAQEGLAPCLDSLEQRLDHPELRQIALVLAADMAAADGVVDASERRVIHALARALGLSAEAAEEALEGPPVSTVQPNS
ncbi:MAG: tellurite resistance TerB family protein [Polyangiaceae bacterium]